MFKKISMVLAATAVMGICMAMMPQKVEAWGAVTFRISQNYLGGYLSPHRLWSRGEARHTDPLGRATVRGFSHIPGGNEWAYFGLQLDGYSYGRANVTQWPWGCPCSYNTCRGFAQYTVRPNMPIVNLTMTHPR